MLRRTFLGALSALPFIGPLLTKSAAPLPVDPVWPNTTKIPGTEHLSYLATNDLERPTRVMAADTWSKPVRVWIFTHHPDGRVTKEEIMWPPNAPK